ncbi:MAG: hypothetical protein K9L78_02160, partial [Victivallales bacterium]|nr:hypothetical protein [Victivallales bacterium]
LLNIAPDKITYEGQSAIRLETYARRAADKKYIPEVFRYDTYLKGKLFCVKWDNLFREFYNRRIWDLTVEAKEKTALSFHKTVSHAAVKMVKHAGEEFQEVKDVVLSGGVFMNRILTALVEEELGRLNYNVNIHSKVPPNDGGISLGQAVIAAKQRI